MEVWEALNANGYAMEQSMRQLRPNWNAWQQADIEYHKLKAKKILELEQQGKSKTLILEIVKGLDEVADLDWKRKEAEGIYRANCEAVNVYKQREQTLRMYFEKEFSYESTR